MNADFGAGITAAEVPRVVAARGDGDMLVDRCHLDAQAGRFEAERAVIRDGQARRLNFARRLFGFPELRDWRPRAGRADRRGNVSSFIPVPAC
jgi:hypothetical protein